METFAPAYFDYMSAAVNAKVRSFAHFTPCSNSNIIASYSSRKDLRVLQSHIQEVRQRQTVGTEQVFPNEFVGDGKSVLRAQFL